MYLQRRSAWILTVIVAVILLPASTFAQGLSGRDGSTSQTFREDLRSRLPSFADFSGDAIRPLPETIQDPAKAYVYPVTLTLDDRVILLAFRERPVPRIWVTKTTDGGETWSPAILVDEDLDPMSMSFLNLTLTQTSSGRILLADESPLEQFGTEGNHLYFSDDGGESWIEGQVADIVGSKWEDWLGRCGNPQTGEAWLDSPGSNTEPIVGPVRDSVWHTFTDIGDGGVKYYTSSDGLEWSDDPTTMLFNPDSATSYLYLRDVVEIGQDSVLAVLKKLEFGPSCPVSTVLSRSFDGGLTWSIPEPLDTDGLPTDQAHLRKAPDGTLWYVFQDVYYDWLIGGSVDAVRLPESDVWYMTSTDGGYSWSHPEQFTGFVGMDAQPDIAFTTTGPLIVFMSNRFMPGDWSNGTDQNYLINPFGWIWFGSPTGGGESQHTMPPLVTFEELTYRRVVGSRENVPVQAQVADEDGIRRVWVEYSSFDGSTRRVELNDDGLSGDAFPDDGEWAGSIGSLPLGAEVDFAVWAEDTDGNQTYSDRIRYYTSPQFWLDLVPARYYVQPRHDVGSVCLELLSAHRPADVPWWRADFVPRSGALGPLPINWPEVEGVASRQWPCPGGPNYLTLGQLMAGVWGVGGQPNPFIITTGWSEVDDPVESSGWSDQDYRIRFEDSEGFGLVVTQQSHQFANAEAEDFIFLEYTVENSGLAGDLDSLIITLYLNAGIGNRSDDLVAFDHQESVIYMFDSGDECSASADEECITGYLGLALVSDQELELAVDQCPICFRDTRDLWSVGISPRLATGDPQTGSALGTLGILVEQLAVGDSARVAFALIMAESQEELLLEKVPRARSIYQDHAASATNRPPTPARITSPLPYTEIWAGAPDSTGVDPSAVLDQSFTWEGSTDPEGEEPSYILQLADQAGFSSPVVAEAGQSNKLDGAFLHSEVKDHLEQVGVALFDSTMLYARVVASDGEMTTFGPHVPLVFRRGTITAIDGEGIPEQFALYRNYPNPFNPATTIRFDLPVSGRVSLQVFDMLGREVARLVDSQLAAGRHRYEWNALNVASGVYLYRLSAGQFNATRTLVVMR
jgi:hypothetical protein